MRFPLTMLAQWCGGSVQGDADAEAAGVSTDSRTLAPGELFLALSGPRFDGHDYVDAAFDRGAVAALVSRETVLAGRSGIVAADTLDALGRLAHARRWQPPLIPWVGVTGSNGKTTTRELVARILSTRGRVWASLKNHNNLVGLPQTLLATPPDAQYGVLELGTNSPGEIRRLTWIALPTVAVVTQIGASHLEKLGTVEGVAREKASIYEHLPSDGLAIYPADDPQAHRLLERIRAPRAGFALSGAADLVATDIRQEEEGMSFRAGGARFRTRLWGRHNVRNVLAASLAARHLGVDFRDAAEALLDFHPVADRLEPVRTRYLTILNDVYNANPASLSAAVETLRDWPAAGRRVAVVGDMLELGRESRMRHARAGRELADADVAVVLAAGRESAALAEAALTHSAHCRVRHFPGTHALTRALPEWLREGDIVLVKGSRAMRLEEAVATAKRWTPPRPERAAP